MMFQFRAILRTLVEHDVDFILVGGLAGVLLYSLTPPNPARLLAALTELGAEFRGDPPKLAPALSHFESRGHKLLTTSFGDLDCLGTIEESTTYEEVIDDVDEMDLGDVRILVISLPRLIEVKRKLTRSKDAVALIQLEATLDERKGS